MPSSSLSRFGVRTTKAQEWVDVTERVQERVTAAKLESGTAVLFVPHTTAGITVNENADPDVQRDFFAALERAVPTRGDYRHAEGNAHAHIKASLLGSAATVIVEGGKLLLGRWQAIYFCEFDGPRTREVCLKLTADSA